MAKVSAEPQPWERQPGETEPAWEAFVAFRDLGPGRTVSAVARELSKSRQLINGWCQRWRWRERAAEWDAEQTRQAAKATADRQQRTVAGHLTAATALLTQALTRLRPTPILDAQGNAVLDDQGQPYLRPAEAAELSAASSALDRAIKHQRLALGLPSDVTRQDVILRDALKEALDTQRAVRAVIEEHLCDDCRARVGAELQRLARRQAGLAGRLE